MMVHIKHSVAEYDLCDLHIDLNIELYMILMAAVAFYPKKMHSKLLQELL